MKIQFEIWKKAPGVNISLQFCDTVLSTFTQLSVLYYTYVPEVHCFLVIQGLMRSYLAGSVYFSPNSYVIQIVLGFVNA